MFVLGILIASREFRKPSCFSFFPICLLSPRFHKAPPPEKKRKETLLSAELGKFLEKKIRVKFQGGREGVYIILRNLCLTVSYARNSSVIAVGILKGYDQLLNLVLDGTIEHLQGICLSMLLIVL